MQIKAEEVSKIIREQIEGFKKITTHSLSLIIL